MAANNWGSTRFPASARVRLKSSRSSRFLTSAWVRLSCSFLVRLSKSWSSSYFRWLSFCTSLTTFWRLMYSAFWLMNSFCVLSKSPANLSFCSVASISWSLRLSLSSCSCPICWRSSVATSSCFCVYISCIFACITDTYCLSLLTSWSWFLSVS